jgi:hypothetical protein
MLSHPREADDLRPDRAGLRHRAELRTSRSRPPEHGQSQKQEYPRWPHRATLSAADHTGNWSDG